MMALATQHQQRDNAPVPFNSGIGFGDSNSKADSRLAAIFTSVRNTIGAPFSMAGRGGDTFGYAGSLLPVRQPCHALATPVWRRGASITLSKEANMPSITRALSRLLPISSTIGTAANLAEAQALARLHLALTGHAVRIAPAAVGFDIVEVR